MGYFDQVIDARWLSSAPGGNAPPAWCGPPCNRVAVCIPTFLGLFQSSDMVIWLGDIHAYSVGAAIELNIRWRDSRMVGPPFTPGAAGRTGLCVGLKTDAGLRLLAVPVARLDRQSMPRTPVLVTTSVRHGHGYASADLWLWPLPAENGTLVLEWQAQRVPECGAEVNLRELADSLDAERTLWPAEGSVAHAQGP